MSKYDWIGWFATALFTASYFCRTPATLRRVQGLAALAWAAYGIAIHAMPIIVANVIVAAVAVWSSFSGLAQPGSGKSE
ncbi:MAG TPA: hypothetical protein VGV12_01270 [Gemmatimonadales bacterium]|nr:hypothetical protein [Gemmatimonadales bacterium]